MSLRPVQIALLAGASLFAGAAAAQAPTPADADPARSAIEASEQAAAQDDPQAGAPEAVEEIVVTGSQIRGARQTGALPLTVVDADRIAATGSLSGDDLFRSIPQAGDVQFQESRTTGNLNDARGDNASINLRNLGTGNTLVLLNGRRMVSTPGTQTENFVPVQTVNTNALPIGATRRVEILRDGAGAIYGSDAVAGVVNVVLDDKYDGLRVDGRYGFADGFSESTVALKAGTKLGNDTRVMLFGSYTHRTPLFASERDYAASEDHRWRVDGTPWEGDTAFDSRTTSSPWGSFTTIPSTTVRQNGTALTSSGVFHVEPVGNTAAGCSSTVYNGNLCLRSGGITGANDRVLRYDENPDRTIRGGLDRINAFATITHDFGGVEFFGEAGYYHAVLDGQREQSAPVSSAPINIPASNYWNPFGAATINGVANPNRLPGLTGVPAGGLAMRLTNYRPVDTGPRTFTVTDDLFRLLGGFRGELGGGWSFDSAISYSWARTDDNTHNAISNTLFQQALARSTPDAYNPFNGGNQSNFSGPDTTPSDPATIRSFLIEVHRISKTSLAMGDFKVSNNSLFSLPAGDVGIAAGVEIRRETYEDNRDPRLDGTTTYTDIVTGTTYDSDILGASASPDVKANRTILSAFAELAVPIVSPAMEIPLVRSLDLQLAARNERYSDFGNVLKPKIAASWGLFEGLKLRGSYSGSFRAPNLPQFYSDGTQVSNTRTDWAFCRINGTINSTCSGASTLEVRAGNQDLGPETAKNLSAGIVVQPPSIRNLTFTADYWSIREKNVIGIQGAQNQIFYDYLLRLSGSSNPNVVRLPPAAGQSVGQLDYVQDNYFNLNPRQLSGIDLELNYTLRDTAIGTFNLDLGAAHLLKFQQQPSAVQQELIEAIAAGRLGPGLTVTGANSLLKQNGNPTWRLSGNLNWRLGAFRAGLLVSHVGSVIDTGPDIVDNRPFKVDSWTTVNLYGEVNLGDEGLLGGTRFRVGARNLFDKAPPLYSSNYGFLGSLHSATGRFVYFELSKRF